MLQTKKEILIPFCVLLLLAIVLTVLPAGGWTWLAVILIAGGVAGVYFWVNRFIFLLLRQSETELKAAQEELKERRITLKQEPGIHIALPRASEEESRKLAGEVMDQLLKKQEKLAERLNLVREKASVFEESRESEDSRNKIILNINDTHKNLAQNIKKAFTISDNLSSDAKRAFTISENVQSGIEVVTNVLHDVSEKSNQLFLQSKKISKIIEIISDIASKTHILSINASIVSARAGKDGKAFEVVSKEIRKLANETDLSLGEIEGEIVKIQEIISKVVTGISSANEETNKEKELLESVIGSLQGVSLGVEVIRAVSMQADAKTVKQKELMDNILACYQGLLAKVDTFLSQNSQDGNDINLDKEIQALSHIGSAS